MLGKVPGLEPSNSAISQIELASAPFSRKATMYSFRTRPEVIAISGVILIIAALWGAWFMQTPSLFVY
jgi:hypothetical protein